MIKETIPAWYGEAEPDGSWAGLFVGKEVLSNLHSIPLESWGNTLFLRKHGPKLACQGHSDGRNHYFDGVTWHDIGPSYGVSPVAFAPDGSVVQNTVEFGSQGIRWIDEQGVHTGDATYVHPTIPGLYEYTTHGDITIGQGGAGGAVGVVAGKRVRIADGDCTFIRFNRVGDACAIAIVVPGGLTLIWATKDELLNLPLDIFPPVAPKPVPIPEPPPKETPKVAEPTYKDNPTAKLEALRATFPTPLGSRHAEFLIKACEAVGNGAGLLAKSSGTFIELPGGTKVSQDWMVFPDGFGTDFLDDGEGAAKVRWGALQEYDKSRYVAVGAISVPPPAPDPKPAPSFDPGPILAQIKAIQDHLQSLDANFGGLYDTLASLVSRVGALESAPEAKYEADCGRSFGHAHKVTIRKV